MALLDGFSYSLTLHAFDIFRTDVDRELLIRKINASRFTVTVSQYNREFLIREFPGVEPAKLRVNYNGIDLELFRCADGPRRAGSVVAIGRLIEKKGFIHLVRALGWLRDRGVIAACSIVGDGPEEAALRHEIARLDLGLQVHLCGPLPQHEVRRLLAESACCVLPCVQAGDGNVDALPTVLLEGMASGCPCISTRLSGIPEIIEDGVSGLLVAPADVPGLGAAIGRMLSEPSVAARLGRAGRQCVEDRFDVRRAAGQMRSWFAEVSGPKSVPLDGVAAPAPAGAATSW
jgi:glycosyltransferase involved in cell wall biosynthesis